MSAKNIQANSIETRTAQIEEFEYDQLAVDALEVEQLNAQQGNFGTVTATQVNAGSIDVDNIANDSITSKAYTVLGTAETGTLGTNMVMRMDTANLGLRRGLGIGPEGENALTDDAPVAADSGIYVKGNEFRVRSNADTVLWADGDLELSSTFGSAVFYGATKTVIGLEGTDLVLQGNVIVSINTTGSVIVDPAVDTIQLDQSAGTFVLALGADLWATREYLLTKVIGDSLDFLPGETQKAIRGALFLPGGDQVPGISSGFVLPGIFGLQQAAIEFAPTIYNSIDTNAFVTMRNIGQAAIGSKPISVAINTATNLLGF